MIGVVWGISNPVSKDLKTHQGTRNFYLMILNHTGLRMAGSSFPKRFMSIV